jgi:HD-GYP domain-containing protein (c-di-GMP phosphodiesterase class II)
MVKRIERDEARVGMFVESLEGAWLDNPFGARRFVLRSETDVDLIKASKITGIYINTVLGVDTDGSRQSSSARQPSSGKVAPSADAQAAAQATVRVVQASVQRLESQLNGAKTGSAIDIKGMSQIVGDISAQIEDSPAILLDMTRLKSRDKVTFVHSVAVSALLVHFGRHLKLEEEQIQLLGVAGLVHDIGKLAIPTEILYKTGALTTEERGIVMQHPAVGYDLLKRQAGMPQIVLDICRHHHERMDGKGYPDSLPGDALSVFVRMSTICDVYEAVTSVRPYKKPWSSSEALIWMLEHSDYFDIPLLWKFIFSLDSEQTRGVI